MFRYSIAISEEDGETHICKTDFAKINKLVTERLDRKPLPYRRKEPTCESAANGASSSAVAQGAEPRVDVG